MSSLSSCMKFLMYLFIFFIIFKSVISQNFSPAPSPTKSLVLNFADQRLAVVYPIIQAFKNTITSDPLGITDTWKGSDVCSFRGFYCDIPPDNASAIALASIDFNGFQLEAPTLDGFIDQLPDLAVFHANTNKFSGIISQKITNLPYLYELDLSNNKFSGHFPTALLAMPGLTFLDIRYNFLTGSVPPQIFMLPLDALFLNNNNFMQRLPDGLGTTPVFYLTLANNKIVGPIPKSIGKASSTLKEVILLNNFLTGCIPYEIGYLKELTVFDGENNLLTGPLPCSFGCLEKIEQLNLAGNLLYGQVPEVICKLGSLVNLSLSDNYFARVGPMCKALIKKGVLDLRKNCIHGLPDQRSFLECTFFLLYPRFCPFPSSYSIIPCKISPGKHPSIRTTKHWVSYTALTRHRL